jgi:23S rRNA (uracil1939-C5)-methyltransferase
MEKINLLQKNETIEILIEKIVVGGEGMGYYNGLAVFVPMSIPGDKLKIKIISTKKTYARGIIESIIIPSKDRIDETNKITFEDFQGCDFGMMKYSAQLKYKKIIVADAMEKIGKIKNILIKDVIPSDNIYNYRNKIIEPFTKYNGKIISGFFKKKSHDVFEVEENILNSKIGNKIIKELKIILNREKLSVYDENTHSGTLRNVMIRTNSNEEAMVVLIINDHKIDRIYKEILLALKSKINNIKSVYISLNTDKTNVAMGKKNILIAGNKTIKENIEGIIFNISPLSFFQINLQQAKKLYDKAINLFSDICNKNIVDGYSGTGTIAMLLAKKAKKVYSIEMVKDAITDGMRAAKENNIQNINFINGKVEEKLLELIENKENIDGIIFDPPRKGIEANVLEAVAKYNIREIVYISCDPATFARDVNILISLGYKIDEVIPFDMFPNVSHVECLGVLYL